MKTCMYLRKSRADLEAEARGEGETLLKHKKALMKAAKQLNLNIVNIREEIVSGESLMHRPQMLELLKEVEQGNYEAVLVMDMDRLGRGKMQEQGLILETFQKSKTKIITPRKTYDLDDEWDEEYSEFEAFMARKELKIITRRLQGGRIRSVEEGNYIATRPPYGYLIKEIDNGRTIEPHPEQADVVKIIFDMYTHEDITKRKGASSIAVELNKMGYKTYTGKQWQNSTVLTIIKNAVYAGRIQWKKKEEKKSTDPSKTKDTRTRPRDEWIDVQGKHEPLVAIETFTRAQEILKGKYHVPYQLTNGITNPLAGLIKCSSCGSSMVYRPYQKQAAHLMCYNRNCDCKSTRFEFVERHLIVGLHDFLDQYKAEWEQRKRPNQKTESLVDIQEKAIHNLTTELEELKKQRQKLHDLLERDIYTEEIFLERSKLLDEKTTQTKLALEQTKIELENMINQNKAQKDIIPSFEKALDTYHKTKDPAKRNTLLKSILEKAEYKKEKHQRGDDFTLVIFPKLHPHR